MKHISIRVPWHDNNWNGCVCPKPSCNTFCKVLPKIALTKTESEDQTAGKDWTSLPQPHRPPCAGENGGFMSPNPHTDVFTHVYAKNGGKHSVLKPTPLEIPAYAAFGTPFWYMSLENQEYISEKHPEFRAVEKAPFNSGWLFGEERQKDILNWFRQNVSSDESLCIFYCKNGNPVDDEGRRMIVGLGDVVKVHPLYEYDSTADYTYPLWEIIFEHSIRPDLGKSKGFLIPYRQYLDLDEETIREKTGLSKDEALDEIKITLDKLGDSDRILNELSYVCEFVSNHSMLAILQAARASVEAVIRHRLVGGDWHLQLKWIDAGIAKVKSMITPFPSFAEALKAIGTNYPYLIEQDLRKAGCGKKDNPWIFYEKLLSGEIVIPGAVYTAELPHYRKTWDYHSHEAKEALMLLSRFEIPWDLIKYYIQSPDHYTRIIHNPYIISEKSAQDFDHRVTTRTIDLGVFADPDIQGLNLPQSPSLVESVIDERRLRSLAVGRLCSALDEGDTLISISEMEEYLTQTLSDQNARLPMGVLLTDKSFFSSEIVYIPEEAPRALQLKEYCKMEEKLRSVLLRRAAKSVKKPVDEDWETIAASDPNYNPRDEKSSRATRQQIQALKMMASKRLSVLTGGAGTGKTTVVRSFLSSTQIQSEGVLLLAPTGKARVRLGNMAKGIEARTVAQFLTKQGCFDFNLMMPRVNGNVTPYAGARNIIIDECSMLTTRDLYVLVTALDLTQINRIILIGDPYQLPPIGAGRPFSDLCNHLLKEGQDDKLRNAITSLRTVVRTIVSGESDVLTLASWFGGDKPKKDADEIFDKIEARNLHNDLRVYYWENEDDLADKLKHALCREMNCSPGEVGEKLRHRMGLNDIDALAQTPENLERFQILTPVLNPVWGSYQLNDFLQQWLGNRAGKNFMQFSTQNIYQCDKIIQLRNEKKESYPSRKKLQLSNGQIGFVKYLKPPFANIAYAGIPNETFGFKNVKGEDADTPIELAYAITIHKSQGSDFDTVLVVLPKSGRILSRELIYTALTRAKSKVILLVQDNIHWLREYSKPQYSTLAKRNSNLFEYSVRGQRTAIPFVEGLIHRTKPDSSGKTLFVRSKSEVIIANELVSAGIKFDYEKLIEEDGRRCIPDFTFGTADGDTIIWEHLGMLGVPEYRASWEKKLGFYKQMGYKEGENLFTTADHDNGSIDSAEVLQVISTIKELI